jgi:hypothetical protein
MRIFSLSFVLALASCGGPAADPKATGATPDANTIACAVAGANDFANDCAVEQSAGKDGTILTIHHPGGGFRRLMIATDGRGVVAADGAEAALVTPIKGDLIEVTLGGDRYRLPATVKGAAKPTP